MVYNLSRAVMAQAPTIPVRTRDDGYREKGEVLRLPYDTLVIPAKGLPNVADVDILPYAPNYRRHFGTKHFEIRYVKDLTWDYWMTWSPARKERRPGGWGLQRRLAGGNVEKPHPDAGKIISHVSPMPLHRVPVGTRIYLPRDGSWDQGVVEEYAHAFEAKRAEKKTAHKAADRKRKRSRFPSVWDRLNSDE
jgi:hypothetical protein